MKPPSLEDRVKQLEAENARIIRALKTAAGHLLSIESGANIDRVTDAVKSAAGQLKKWLKQDEE